MFTVNAISFMEVGSLSGYPRLVNLLPYSRVKISRSGYVFKQIDINKIITKFELDVDGGKYEDYPVDNLVWIRNTNIEDPVLGTSPLKKLIMPISNVRASYGFS
jgi:hypothetical protein